MKVCLDAQAAVGQRAGVGRYAKCLAEALSERIHPDELELFWFDWRGRSAAIRLPGISTRVQRWTPRRLVQAGWEAFGWPPFDRFSGPADVLTLIRSQAAPFVVIDLERVGGLVPARKCASIAQAAGLSAMLGGGPSLGVGVAAMLQLAAATPALSGCNECAYHQLQDDLLVEPLEIVDGMIVVPQGPGLGVEIDRAKVEQYQVS